MLEYPKLKNRRENMTSIALPPEETRATTARTNPFEISNPRSEIPPFKRPLSAKRLAANRANAQKSTGPRTQKRKRKHTQNTTTQGLTSTRRPDPRPSTAHHTSRLTTIHRTLADITKRRQQNLKEQQELEDDLRRSRLIAEETLAHQRHIHQFQREQDARRPRLTPSPPEYSKDRPGDGRG